MTESLPDAVNGNFVWEIMSFVILIGGGVLVVVGIWHV